MENIRFGFVEEGVIWMMDSINRCEQNQIRRLKETIFIRWLADTTYYSRLDVYFKCLQVSKAPAFD